jgi:glycerol 2-dehydrogenase (NADP+)
MEKLLETGKVKTIGVSNFSIKTLNELLPHVKVVPATNQVEAHPCLPQDDLIKYCEEKGILVVAYSPLGEPCSPRNQLSYITCYDELQGRSSTFFEHDGVKSVATKYNATSAQVVLSWAVQRKTAVIPKSENEQRLKDNFTVSSFCSYRLHIS